MTSPKKQAADFTLFESEDRIIERADEIMLGLEDTTKLIKTLSSAYKRAVKEQKRMVRLSDRMQDELRAVQARLEGEVQARAELAEQFRLQAITDGLTGLFNRRHFLDLCHHELRSRSRTQHPLSVALLDIDKFKAVNDTHGHAGGDEALKVVAATLTGNLRQSDVVARWGGEEFAILMPETQSDDALRLAERLRKTLSEQTVFEGELAFQVTASFGVATLEGPNPASENPGHDPIDSLFKCADDALYDAKRSGRNRVHAAYCASGCGAANPDVDCKGPSGHGS